MQDIFLPCLTPIIVLPRLLANKVLKNPSKLFLHFMANESKKLTTLENLPDFVVAIEPKLSPTLKEAGKLTPYAVEIRYPDYSIEINKKTTLEAIKIAQSILDLFLDIVEKSSDDNQL